MNLSNHSESIHWSIQLLRDGVKRLQIKDNVDWLNGLFKKLGLSGWLLSLVKAGLLILVVIVVMLLVLPCLISCL